MDAYAKALSEAFPCFDIFDTAVAQENVVPPTMAEEGVEALESDEEPGYQAVSDDDDEKAPESWNFEGKHTGPQPGNAQQSVASSSRDPIIFFRSEQQQQQQQQQ